MRLIEIFGGGGGGGRRPSWGSGHISSVLQDLAAKSCMLICLLDAFHHADLDSLRRLHALKLGCQSDVVNSPRPLLTST